MNYVAIALFSRDRNQVKEIVSRRRDYKYPAEFKGVRSYLDVQGGRAVVFFETESADSILKYTADWPELTFDVFPVVPSEKAWEAYLVARP